MVTPLLLTMTDMSSSYTMLGLWDISLTCGASLTNFRVLARCLLSLS